MSTREPPPPLVFPAVYTIRDIMQKTGLTSHAIGRRMRARAGYTGPLKKFGTNYMFTREQFEILCENYGLGWAAVKEHAKKQGKTAPPKRRRRSRKAS